MTALDIFTYSGQQVRTVVINGEPWFVAADVATILGYRMASDLTRSLDDDEKGTHETRTPSGDQWISVITEAGLFKALVQRQTGRMADESIKAFVKAFQRFVTHEVLPAIRKTGTYSTNPALPQSYADALRELAVSVEQKEALAAKVEQQAPLVAQALTYQDAGNLTTRAVFAREIIKWALAEGYTVKQPEVLAFLSTKLGLFVRGARGDNGEATLDAERRGLATTVKGTANGHNYATGKLTAAGVTYAWARITRHINETGALELRHLAVAS